MRQYLILLPIFGIVFSTSFAAPQDCNQYTNPKVQAECKQLDNLVAQKQQAFNEDTKAQIGTRNKFFLNRLPSGQAGGVAPAINPYRQVPTTQFPPERSGPPAVPPNQTQQFEQQLKKQNRIYY